MVTVFVMGAGKEKRGVGRDGYHSSCFYTVHGTYEAVTTSKYVTIAYLLYSIWSVSNTASRPTSN